MSLVGDIIMGVREQMTDLPQALSAPLAINISTTAPIAGVQFPSTTVVYYQITQLNPWGESTPTPLTTFTVPGGGPFSLVFAGACSYTATAVRVYFSTIASAPLDQYFQLTLSTQGTFVVIVGGTQTGFTTPPVRSSAWLPDTDGTSASASTIYRWLGDGLETASTITDGIRDITGIPSTVGVAQYPLVGLWKKIDNNFYDGYPVEQGTKMQIFRHSPVTGLSGTVTMNVSSDRQIVEFWPQPERTAGTGLLSAAITPTSTSLAFTPGTSGFVLGFGLALIGTYPPTATQSQTGPASCELVYYSGTGSGTLQSLTRSMGGTQPQSWPIGTPIYEINAYMTGLRLPIKYSVGQALLSLSLPPAWVDAIRVYMLYRFRDAEQNRNEASSLLKEFEAKCQAIRGNRQVMGPRRIQVGGSGVEVASGFGSPFGGIILP